MGRGGSGPGLGLAVVATGRRRAAHRSPADYGPGAARVWDLQWSRLAGDGGLIAARRTTVLGPRGPDGPRVDYTQCASSCGIGTHRLHAASQRRSPSTSSPPCLILPS